MAFPYVPNPTWQNDASGGTEIDAAALNLMEQGIVKAGIRGTGSTPPSSPTDGDLWRYPADATNGVYWLFQYLTSATDWLFIGGPPLYAEVTTSQNVASATYVDLATAGPSLTAPFAGDYLLTYGARVNIPGTQSFTFFVAPKIGSAATSDADAALHSSPGVAGAHAVDGTVACSRRKTLAASDVIKLQYRGDLATSTAVLDRWLTMLPVRFTSA